MLTLVWETKPLAQRSLKKMSKHLMMVRNNTRVSKETSANLYPKAKVQVPRSQRLIMTMLFSCIAARA